MVVFINYMFLPEPCLVCGGLTHRTLRIRGAFYFVCEMCKGRFELEGAEG